MSNTAIPDQTTVSESTCREYTSSQASSGLSFCFLPWLDTLREVAFLALPAPNSESHVTAESALDKGLSRVLTLERRLLGCGLRCSGCFGLFALGFRLKIAVFAVRRGWGAEFFVRVLLRKFWKIMVYWRWLTRGIRWVGLNQWCRVKIIKYRTYNERFKHASKSGL